MSPSEKWRRENPEIAGELVLIDGEFWQSGGAHCTIEGWATHPEFLSERSHEMKLIQNGVPFPRHGTSDKRCA